MVPRRFRLGVAIAAWVCGGGSLAIATETARIPPVNLAAAVARTAAEPGWRTEQLADGRLVTVGVNVAEDVTQVIGIACGSGHRPEVAVDARGSIAMPRAFVLEVGGQLAAIPVAPSGAGTEGVDALLHALAATAGGALRLWLDERPFPTEGAREALEPIWKQCEQLFGWRITDPDPQQLFWSYLPDRAGAPALVFKGPGSDAPVAAIACDPNSGSVSVSVADLVKGGRRAQSVGFVLEASGESFDIAGRTDPTESDGTAMVTGSLSEPDNLLRALADASRLTFRTRTAAVTVPTEPLRILLPRFRHACALP